jgi:porin
MMELNYRAQMTPAIRVMPNVQYVLNPDQSGDPYRKTNIKWWG